MNKQGTRRALGRGLSNLIPTQSEDQNGADEIHLLDISSIKTNPFQPRIDFDDDEIKGLAESIENQGLLQPVVVRQKENSYEIISGERRFRAFNYLKREKVPCIVKTDVTDREMLELALVENIQREELNEIEKAVAYQKLLLECNYTHDQLSKQLGKSRTAITNSLRLLNLPDEIQQMVRKELITMGHARALLSIEQTEKQLLLARKVVDEQLSVRDVEKETQGSKTEKKIKQPVEKKEKIDPDIADVLQKLRYKFGTSVDIKNLSLEKGRIEINYFSKADLVRLVDILLV